ncbi:MAG: hypothetical protein ABFC57_01395 [Veillonellales bacterium]
MLLAGNSNIMEDEIVFHQNEKRKVLSDLKNLAFFSYFSLAQGLFLSAVKKIMAVKYPYYLLHKFVLCVCFFKIGLRGEGFNV